MINNQPKITDNHIIQIRQLIAENPDWNRTRLSKELCILWDWRSPTNQIKDISARYLLRSLDKKGLINLPAARWTPRAPGGKGSDKIRYVEHDTSPINADLRELMPLNIMIVSSKQDIDLFKLYINMYHYLGFNRVIGENMKYIVRSNSGSFLACLLFGSAAWSCKKRDVFIGWDHEQRQSGLPLLANNVRFLIPEFVRVNCLASHVLSLIAHRISADWETKYGHPVHLLETFVDERFHGTVYKASNWIYVGKTTGRGRNDRMKERALSEKAIYLLPLNRRWKESLLIRQKSGGNPP